MTQTTPSADQHQFVRASPWKRVFRIIRWTTYTFALVTLVLLLHKAPPPLVETSPQAATSGAAPTPQEVEQMRSNVRDVKVQLIDDRVKAYVVFDVHGKDMTLQLEGRLGAQNGYLHFEPLSGQIGSLPIPQSTLESAVHRLMDSPENREKLKLPSEISDLRIENGEVVVGYK